MKAKLVKRDRLILRIKVAGSAVEIEELRKAYRALAAFSSTHITAQEMRQAFDDAAGVYSDLREAAHE